MNTMDTFRLKMKNKRETLGITLKEIAEEIGVQEATVQRYESGNGIKSVPYDKIVAISKVLKCSPAYLMGWENEQTSDETSHAKARMLMDPQFVKLFSYWEQLSDEGKQKLKDYANDLYKIYKK